MQNTIKILIDLKKEMYRFDQAQQGDDVILDITLLENGVAKDLTGETVELIYINANNTVASVTGDKIIVSGNNVKITCPTDCTRSYGIAKFQLKIISTYQVSTFPIALTIVPSVDQNQQISQNISTILEQLTAKNIECGETLDSLNEWVAAHGDIVALDARLTAAENTIIDHTSQLAESSNEITTINSIKNNKEAYISTGTVTPKAIYNNGGHIFVVTQKPNGNGYIRTRMRNDIVDTSVDSVGGDGQLLRVVEVLNATEVFSLKHSELNNSNTSKWTTSNINYGDILIEARINSASSPTIDDWIEYSVTIPPGVYGIECLIYGTSGSSTNITVTIDGVNVQTNVSFMKSTAKWFRHYIPISPGEHIVRFTTNTAQYMTIGGVGVTDLFNYKKGLSYDKLVVVYSNTNPYITNAGAIDYAMFDSDLNLYCGSYHGGETRSGINYILDGSSITLADNQIKIGNVFEIEQDTSIVSKINAYSRYIYKQDGVIEFEVYFKGNINLTRLFTNMTTTHVDYTKVIYPSSVDVTTDGAYSLPLGANYIIQKNPNNNQKLITIMNDNMVGGTPVQPYVLSSQYYRKLYKENIKSDTPINFKEGNFKSIHIFE